MSILRNIPMRAFYVLIAALAIGLAFWQYDLAMGDKKSSVEISAPSGLEFKLSDGSTVAVPADTDKVTVVVFWSVASERSVSLAGELIHVAQSREYDSVFAFYAVNLADSPDALRRVVDFDNAELPFGYDPSGRLLEETPIRTLPLTLMLSGRGAVIARIEGYEAGALVYQLEQYLATRNFLGSSTGLKFKVD